MARLVGKLAAANGKYMKDGEEKTSWLICGVLLETDKGFRAKIESLPAHIPEGGLWLNVFEDEQKPAAQQGFREPAATPPADPKLPF